MAPQARKMRILIAQLITTLIWAIIFPLARSQFDLYDSDSLILGSSNVYRPNVTHIHTTADPVSKGIRHVEDYRQEEVWNLIGRMSDYQTNSRIYSR